MIYPPRDACPACLSARLPFRDVDRGGTLVAETTVQTSTDPYFRERTPWRVGTVKLDAGPVVVAHLHGDAVEGGRVRLEFKLDKSGSAVAIALPAKDTPNMADDPHLREMTCDPKFRRVLITDGRNAVGQAMAKAFSRRGRRASCSSASPMPGSRFPAMDALRKIERRRDRAARRDRHRIRSPSWPSRTARASTSSSTPPSMSAPAAWSSATA